MVICWSNQESQPHLYHKILVPINLVAREVVRVVLSRDYCGLTGGFLLLRNFSVAILILISMFLR